MRIHNIKLGNQILSLLMALVMVISMLPMSSFTAFAADATDTDTAADTTYPYAVVDTAAGTVTIDGTLGGKTTAEESDITALVDAIKGYVDSGITTISVTGSEPALYNFYSVDTPAVSVAIFRLTEDSESSVGSGDPDSPYCGKIDLILQDVTEIVEMEFNNSFALNSITLPKVTKLGAQAFALCNYLQTITFGSVVTEGIENGEQVFNSVGSKVDGGLCNLVLSCGQVNAEAEYQPNIETKEWWKTPWKHITLAHTNSYQDLGNGTHSAVCSVCGGTGTEDHSGGEATCTTLAICSGCGVSYGEVDSDNHTAEPTYTLNTADSTKHNVTYSCCGTFTEDHSGGEATCKTQAVCVLCDTSYGELDADAHSFDETTGFCTVCGGYQPAVLNEDGVYEISNAGQLYWFAAVVNGGYGDVAQNTSANAVLTENITVNENVLKADGALNGDGTSFRVWTPIGNSSNQYEGTFDGNNKTVSGLYFNDSDTKYVGLFGHVGNGTVKNVGVIDSYLRGYLYVGGVVGYYYGRLGDDPYGTVTNCYNTGAVSGNRQVGGVVGNMYEGTVQSCYNTGTVSCSSYVGGVVGYMYKGTVQSCYYLSGTAAGGINGSDVTGSAEAKTAAQFASGEVAYLLNGDQSTIVFMQTLGTDDYPNFTGAKVYSGYDSCAETATAIYTNDSTVPAEKLAHSGGEATCQKQAVCVLCGTSYGELNSENHEYVNGVCPCGAIAPIEKNANGIYEIYVPEQLVEFAQIVNGTHATIPQDKAANAILKADIDMTGIDWTPICSTGLYYGSSYASGYGDADTGYAGTFDGNYHVIKNLSVTAIANETWTYGLFGTMTGTVKNLGIEGFTYNHNGASDMRTGAIVGQNLGGTIENCYVVKATITPGTNVAGGIAGCNYAGTIQNCYVADSNVLASASSSTIRYGYIVGDNRADTAGDRVGTIENCYTDGDRLVGSYTGTETNSKYGVNYNYFTNGGVVWYLNGQSADGIWKQGETHPNFTGTAVTQSLLSTYTQPEIKDGVYQIKTESELRWFAEYVNFTDASVSAVLANDIAMTGDNWIPIGMYGTPFTGTFDGQGYSITGFAMTITEGGRFGLFGEISGATVKNFSIDGEVTANLPSQQTFYYGVIGASANSTITDIHSSVGLKVKDSFDKNGIAGIVASITTTTIERCSFSGTLDIGTAYIDCAGGIVGYAGWNNTHVIRDCAFYGKIIAKHESSDKTSSGQIGGILGYYRGSNITIESCLSVGTFDVANTTFTGMIGGRVLQMGADNISKVSNNYYYGNLPAFSDTEDNTHGYWSADMADYEGYGDTNAKSVTDTQLKSGEVTWLLNGSTTENAVWYQTIGLHDYPVFEGATVNLNGTTYENTGNFIYVEITWTAMEFTYQPETWNPQTLKYDAAGWVPDTDGTGTVTVTNKGAAVYVSLGYTSLVDGVSGSFDPANTSICLEKGESVGASLNLTGEPTGGPFTDRQIGTVTVTISQTPPAAMTATWEVGDTVEYIGKNGKAYSCYIVSESDGKYVLLTKEPEIFNTSSSGAASSELEALRKTQLEEVGAARYPTYRVDDADEYLAYESYLDEVLPQNPYGNGGCFSPMVNEDGHDRWACKSASSGNIAWGYSASGAKQGYFYYVFEVPVS